jgi:hypothetical protein
MREDAILPRKTAAAVTAPRKLTREHQSLLQVTGERFVTRAARRNQGRRHFASNDLCQTLFRSRSVDVSRRDSGSAAKMPRLHSSLHCARHWGRNLAVNGDRYKDVVAIWQRGSAFISRDTTSTAAHRIDTHCYPVRHPVRFIASFHRIWSEAMENARAYYQNHGPMTATGPLSAEFGTLPTDLASLCEIIQGVLIHRDLAPFLYRLTLSAQQLDEAHIRPVTEMLTRIHARDLRPLSIAREPGHRLAGVCRHFATMLTAILRQQGIAARARCGFGAYFNPERFEDHWVCEYWNVRQARWVLVDAQLDAVQHAAFHLDFDPLDVPRDRFVVAGDAWQMCRTGKVAPARFGLTHIGLQGLWFVAGNLLRDLAALNRMEMLPWDVWGLMPKPDEALSNENLALFDRLAALTLAGDETFFAIREIYDRDDRLRVPSVVFNALRNVPESITS